MNMFKNQNISKLFALLLLITMWICIISISPFTKTIFAQSNNNKPEGQVLDDCKASYEYAHSQCRCGIGQCRLSVFATVADTIGIGDKNAPVGLYFIPGVGPTLAVLGLVVWAIAKSVTAQNKYICFRGTSTGTPVDVKYLENEGFVTAKLVAIPPAIRTTDPSNPVEDWKEWWRNTEIGAETKVTVKYLRDDYARPGFGNLIPIDAVCKLASDGKTAYWSYNPYKIIDPNANSQISRAMGCVNPLLSSQDLFGNRVLGTSTFFGCLPNSINGLTAFIVRLITGLAVFFNLLIILLNVAAVLGNPTAPDVIGAAQKRIINSILVLMSILFAIFFLRLFGIIIFGIELL